MNQSVVEVLNELRGRERQHVFVSAQEHSWFSVGCGELEVSLFISFESNRLKPPGIIFSFTFWLSGAL